MKAVVSIAFALGFLVILKDARSERRTARLQGKRKKGRVSSADRRARTAFEIVGHRRPAKRGSDNRSHSPRNRAWLLWLRHTASLLAPVPNLRGRVQRQKNRQSVHRCHCVAWRSIAGGTDKRPRHLASAGARRV